MTTILNNVYNGVKGFIAITVGLSSIPIFIGKIIYPFNVIIGGYDILIMVMLLVDTGLTSKVVKLLGVQIDRLNGENLHFSQNNLVLGNKLESLETEVSSLRDLTEQYEQNNQDFVNEIDILSVNNENLDSHIEQLVHQIDGLKIVQDQAKQLIASLMTVKALLVIVLFCFLNRSV